MNKIEELIEDILSGKIKYLNSEDLGELLILNTHRFKVIIDDVVEVDDYINYFKFIFKIDNRYFKVIYGWDYNTGIDNSYSDNEIVEVEPYQELVTKYRNIKI